MGRGNIMMFSNQLSKLRKEMKITQELLAEKCDVSRQAVAKWERGESLPSIYKLIEIADLFQVSLDELVLGGAVRDDKKEIAREIYNLYVENIESLRSCMLQQRFKSDVKLVTELRTVVKKSRLVFTRETVDELFEMTYDFGEYSGDVLKKYKDEITNGPGAYQRYCEVIIPRMYGRIEEILGEYLELQ